LALPAIATILGPPAGVALYLAAGAVPPLVLAALLGLVAFGVTLVIAVPPTRRAAEPAQNGAPRRGRDPMLEPTAIPSTLMVTTFMAGHSLFIVFPPVYLAAVGVEPAILAPYYLLYGLVMTISQLLVGRVSDRLGRDLTIRLGSGLAIAGFAAAFVLHGLPALVVGAAAYATAVSFVSPTLSALTIDRAPPERIGAAMATYSLGYQVATGASGVVWGALIAVVGFPWPFALAIALQLTTIAVSVVTGRRTAHAVAYTGAATRQEARTRD
jgi:predicted MFS family arabinose efflux permease